MFLTWPGLCNSWQYSFINGNRVDSALRDNDILPYFMTVIPLLLENTYCTNFHRYKRSINNPDILNYPLAFVHKKQKIIPTSPWDRLNCGKWIMQVVAILLFFITMTGPWAVIEVCSTHICMVQCTHLITTGGTPHLYNTRGSSMLVNSLHSGENNM